MSKQLIRLSKFLSLVLRHQPQQIGLQLDAQGWAQVDALLSKAQAAQVDLSRELLEQLVASSDKQRFAFNADHSAIRANQGHSVAVDLGLSAQTPPPLLYHGTVERYLAAILQQGLVPKQRHAVHLSADIVTARRVGERRGTAVILRVDAAAMHAAGLRFECSDNGVWLTAHVPPHYLQRVE